MSNPSQSSAYYIGWDVGAWNCTKRSKSCDAIVILDAKLELVGKPWRDNLRESISNANTTREWLTALFKACGEDFPEGEVQVTMAIDAPLGFSDEFIGLITKQEWLDPDGIYKNNRYLFRETERRLFKPPLKPLSAINDRIGAQATKAMHALAKFSLKVESCGVWTDGCGFRAIETYPAACRGKKEILRLQEGRDFGNKDKNDALVCALVAHLFAIKSGVLEGPDGTVSEREGWIWA